MDLKSQSSFKLFHVEALNFMILWEVVNSSTFSQPPLILLVYSTWPLTYPCWYCFRNSCFCEKHSTLTALASLKFKKISSLRILCHLWNGCQLIYIFCFVSTSFLILWLLLLEPLTIWRKLKPTFTWYILFWRWKCSCCRWIFGGHPTKEATQCLQIITLSSRLHVPSFPSNLLLIHKLFKNLIVA